MPNSTIGNEVTLRVCTRVRASNISSKVPKPRTPIPAAIARVRAVTIPIRSPVKGPGPMPTAIRASSVKPIPWAASNSSIIGISSIHLLKTFINAGNYTDKVLIAQTLIHITFLFSAMAIAYTDKLMSAGEAHRH